MNRCLGRKIPAPLPAHRMLSRVSPSLPPSVDLTKWAGPIKDQGQLGSCTGHAFSSAMEWIFRKYHNKQPVLSPLYLYSKELILDGNFPADDGSDGVTGSNVTIANGCCEDSLYPDSGGHILKPTASQDANAGLYRMGAYHGLTGSQVALSVLGDPVPWPVEMGFSIDDNFQSDEVAKTGIYVPSGKNTGDGHEVLLLGYDVGATPTIRPASCPPAVKVQNSWTDMWGEKGYFWCAISVLDAKDTDLKVVHSGSPWK